MDKLTIDDVELYRVNDSGVYGTIIPDGGACDGLRRASDIWGGCHPVLYNTPEGIYISGCDDSTDEPVTHCPYCGRPFVRNIGQFEETVKWLN